MNARKMVWVMMVALMLSGAVNAKEGRPYIGVRLDAEPLPELLSKHLGLKPGQGIRIRNVNVGSPADQAGFERDDIIIRFQGHDVMDLDQFVHAVQSAGSGTKVTLEIVHLGQRKTLEIELAVLQGSPKWKYPPEPEAVTTWRPGKVFRVAPDGDDWVEIRIDDMPDVSTEIKRFFNQVHTYHHSTDGEDYTISIEGDPRDEKSQVTVHAEDGKYSTGVGQLEALPEKYRDSAREAIESAKKSSKKLFLTDKFRLPKPPKPDAYRKYFEQIKIPRPNIEEWSERKDQALEKLQEQMEGLQRRMEEFERHHQETLEKLLDRMKEHNGDGDASDKAAVPEPEAEPTI